MYPQICLGTRLWYFRTRLPVYFLSSVPSISCLIIPQHCWQLAYAFFVPFLTYFICLMLRWLMPCCHWRLKMVTLSLVIFLNLLLVKLAFLPCLLTLSIWWRWLICCCFWRFRMISPSLVFFNSAYGRHYSSTSWWWTTTLNTCINSWRSFLNFLNILNIP